MTTKKAPVSVCMITRKDPHLEACIKSFVDYVEEICIVINDPDDKESVDVANKYGAKLLITTECNDDQGRINNFSMARNESLALATQPWLMWIDSDDIVTGMGNLNSIIDSAQPNQAFIFPYEYAYNTNNQVLCRHYRERLFRKDTCHFINPVHEVCVPKNNNIQFVSNETIIFKHQRQFITKSHESERNLRILKEYVKENPDDVRNMYYIGLEYSNCNQFDEAIQYLSKYIDKSGWDDERAMAAYKLVEIYSAKQDFKTGLKWAFKSLEIKDWFESFNAISKMFYFLNNLSRCAYYGKLALSQPKTETLLFVNDTDRFTIHTYLNIALNSIGEVQAALDSVLAGLVGLPTDQNLLHNKTIYLKHLRSLHPVVEKPLDKEHLDIVFVAGPSYEQWDPESVKKTGIGGSEMMLIHQAKNLAALGHHVKVYGSPFNPGSKFDNVEYLDVNTFGNFSCDVLVVSRYAVFLSDQMNVKAKLKLLWCHDVTAIGATNDLLLKADRILALSEWHKNNLVKEHNIHPDQVIVTRNGIDVNRFKNKNILKKQYQCINSSSPDRSWPVLLEVWPEIKKQRPDAELHLCYGFANWEKSAKNQPLQLDLIKRLKDQIETLDGVTYHGRVDQDELADIMMQSKAILHPSWFTETSGITFMEGQQAGLWIITSPLAALPETIKNYDKVLWIKGEWTSDEYKKKFIEATIKALDEKM